VTDLRGDHIRNYPASAPGIISNHMASPVLAGGRLVYCHRDGAAMYGLDTATGRVAWRTDSPTVPSDHRDWKSRGGKPRGYQGHMGPGGTPVVMRLGGTTVVVSGHGMVVRASDGRLLGQVKLPEGTPVGKGKAVAPAEEDYYGSSYNSWVSHDDVLFYQPKAGLYAIKLALDAEALTQQVLWRLDAAVDYRNPNLVYRDGKVYAKARVGRRGGIVAIDATTGEIVTRGPGSGGHDTSLGFARDLAVWPAGYTGDKTEHKSNPAHVPGHGMTRYTVVSLPGLEPVGEGYLCPAAPAGELADRHIAGIGTARVVWGNAGITCWGNRIFVRNNDYLWCIGDPEKAWVSPEKHLKR
jgi:outer membrane protein assembly factor BamB